MLTNNSDSNQTLENAAQNINSNVMLPHGQVNDAVQEASNETLPPAPVPTQAASATAKTHKILSDNAHIKKLIKNYLKAELKNLPYLNSLYQASSANTNANSSQTQQQQQQQQQQPQQKLLRNSSQTTLPAGLSLNYESSKRNANVAKSGTAGGDSKNLNEFVGPFYDKSTNQIFFKDKLNNIVNNNLSVTIPNIGSNVNRIFTTPANTNANANATTNPTSNANANANTTATATTPSSDASNTVKAPSVYYKTDTNKRFNLEDYLYKPSSAATLVEVPKTLAATQANMKPR